MVDAKIDVHSTVHYHKVFQKRFDQLIGLEREKEDFLFGLRVILDNEGLTNWQKKHHKNGLPFLDRFSSRAPVIILSGDVGCGKTELALSVGSPLSKQMGGKPIRVFETPTDIRAGGFVGDIGKRIVATFKDVKSKLKKDEFGILIIDEADDLATSREQMQAHHEDRAGVNVLIKEIDQLQNLERKIAVILITNRGSAIDPAVRRRASLQIQFNRPGKDAIQKLLQGVLDGVGYTKPQLADLVAECLKKEPGYTSSDIIRKVGENALIQAIKTDLPLSTNLLKQVIIETKPSPVFKQYE